MGNETQLHMVLPEENIPLNWQPGHVIAGLYEVEGTTSGGMGAVFFVKHLYWGIRLAVKTPLPEMVKDEASMKRFIREAETWVDLGIHPHIATCYYVRILDGLPRIFIEYVNGGSLKEQLGEEKVRELLEILDIAIQISRGMDYVHEKGVIHRDLKPANCLITKGGIVKVTDFGLVKVGEDIKEIIKINLKAAEGSISITGGGFGTPEYMAPEQFIDAKHVSKAADIYSFGVMLFEMVCRRKPFVMPEEMHPMMRGEFYEKAHQNELPPEPVTLNRDCPGALGDLILRCLEKSSNKRGLLSFKEIERRLIGLYEEKAGVAYPRKRPDPLKLRPDALNNKALSLLDLGHEKEAEKCWDEALKSDPVHLSSKFNYGYYQWNKGKLDPYKDYYLALKQLEESHSSDHEYWVNLILICEDIGLTERANEAYRNLLTTIVPQPSSFIREFKGHSDSVLSVVISPDYRYIISGSRDKTIRLWNMEDAKCLWILKGVSEINSIAISRDNRYIVSGGEDKTVRVWELKTGRCLNIFKGHTGPVLSVVISQDGRYIVSGGEDKTIRTWGISTGRCLKVFEGHTGWVESVCLTSDSRYIISGSKDGTLRLWKIDEERCFNILKGHTGSVLSVAISHDSRYIVSGGEDKTVRLWEISTAKCLKLFEGHTGWVESVSISQDGRYIISGGWDKTVRVWEIETERCLRVFEGHTKEVNSVSISLDGKFVLSGGGDFTLRLWEVRKPKLFHYIISVPLSSEVIQEREEKIDSFISNASSLIKDGKCGKAYALLKDARKIPGCSMDPQILDLINICGLKSGKRVRLHSAVCLKIYEGHSKGVNSLCITSDYRYVVSGGSDNTIRLWERETSGCRVFEGHTKGVNSVCVSHDGRYIISGGSDNTIRLWERETGRCKVFEGHKGPVRSIAMTCDGRYIISGGWDKTLRLWNIERGKCLKIFEGHTGFVRSINITPDGRYIVSGGWDKTVRLWDMERGKCLKVFEGHNGWIESVSITSDGRYVVSGGEDKTIRIWEMPNGKCLKILEGHTDRITSLFLTPDGRYVISGGEDKTVRVWEASTGRCSNIFEGHTDRVTSLFLTPDGRYVISGSEDKTIRLWELDWEWEFPEEKPLYNKEKLELDTKSVETKMKEEVLNKETLLKQENSQPRNDTIPRF